MAVSPVYPKLEARNLKLLTFALVFLMTLTAFAQQPLAAPQAVTDPTKLESKTVADMSTFSIEKLYMTRLIGRLDLVARRQADRLHLQHQRPQQSLAGAGHRRLADAAHHQRPAPVGAGVVARRNLDRLHLRSRRRRAVGHLHGLAQDRRRREPDDLAGVRRSRARPGRPTAARWPTPPSRRPDRATRSS